MLPEFLACYLSLPYFAFTQQAGKQGRHQAGKAGKEATSVSVARNSDHYTTEAVRYCSNSAFNSHVSAFGLGTLVFNGLEMAMHSMMEGACLNDVVFVHPVLHGLFTFLQMHFLFVNSQVRPGSINIQRLIRGTVMSHPLGGLKDGVGVITASG